MTATFLTSKCPTLVGAEIKGIGNQAGALPRWSGDGIAVVENFRKGINAAQGEAAGQAAAQVDL